MRSQGLSRSLVLTALVLSACATQSSRTITPDTVASAGTAYDGPKHAILVGGFKNASPYMRGVFADGQDRLGGQARTLLRKDLVHSGRFTVVDRETMKLAEKEAEIAGEDRTLTAAKLVIVGEVTEFGRKQVGDKQLFGLGGRGKTQSAYSKVTLNVVDVKSGEIVYSVEGAGEYSLSNREVLGFGSTAAYDSTLNGKVLSLSVAEAVNRLVEGVEQGAWSPKQ